MQSAVIKSFTVLKNAGVFKLLPRSKIKALAKARAFFDNANFSVVASPAFIGAKQSQPGI